MSRDDASGVISGAFFLPLVLPVSNFLHLGLLDLPSEEEDLVRPAAYQTGYLGAPRVELARTETENQRIMTIPGRWK